MNKDINYISADEMFKELGYTKEYCNRYTTFDEEGYPKEVVFMNKEFYCLTRKEDFIGWGAIDMSLLKAINKKIEELGW